MMLPILISVSVTPVSYFFCAAAGTETAAMISPERPSERPSVLKNCVLKNCVLMKSLARRFIELPPWARRDGFLSDCFLKCFFCDGVHDSRRAGWPEAAPD